MKWTKEMIMEVFGPYPNDGSGICEYDSLYTGILNRGKMICDEKESNLLFLAYRENAVIEGTLDGDWELFRTDKLDGCIFVAYEDVSGKTKVVHVNNKNLDNPSNPDCRIQKDRFRIHVKDGMMTLYKNPLGQEEQLLAVQLDKLVLCCYPKQTTVVDGCDDSSKNDTFVEYNISDKGCDGYCSVLATHEPNGEIFYLFIKEPDTDTQMGHINMKEVPHLKGGGCILI